MTRPLRAALDAPDLNAVRLLTAIVHEKPWSPLPGDDTMPRPVVAETVLVVRPTPLLRRERRDPNNETGVEQWLCGGMTFRIILLYRVGISDVATCDRRGAERVCGFRFFASAK